MLALEIDGRAFQPSAALPHFGGHAVERFDERPELVVADRLAIDAIVEMPGLDLASGGRQPLHGLGDPLRQVQAHPRRAHENHERHHQEERQVDARERLPQHAQIAVVLVGILNPPRPAGKIPDKEVARDDDGHRLSRARPAHDRGGADELATARQLLRGRRLDFSNRGLRRHAIGHCLRVALRHLGRGDGDIGHRFGRLRTGDHAIDFDHLHASLHHLRHNPIAHRSDVGAVERRCRQHACHSPGVGRHPFLTIAVVVARDQIGGGEHFLDRRAEPAIDAVANQLAAHEQDEHGGNERHAEQHGHELPAEARERQRAAPLDDELDDVAREHEREAEEDREVGRPQPVKDEFGEKVGRESGRSIRQRNNPHQRGEQDDHACQNEPRIVAQRAARRHHGQPCLIPWRSADLSTRS